METTVSVYYLVGRNLDEAHHTVCLDKRKKYINNAVVILTYPSPQKTLRLLKLLYFLRMQSITLRFSSRASLGALADKNCKRMLRSKKRHITNNSKSCKIQNSYRNEWSNKEFKKFWILENWKISKLYDEILVTANWRK